MVWNGMSGIERQNPGEKKYNKLDNINFILHTIYNILDTHIDFQGA